MPGFAGKVVVITGGGAGIGRTLGQRFAAEGASIVIADVDHAAGDRMVEELVAAGREGLSFPMDVRNTEAAARMAERTVDTFGGIDVLVNNAGIHLHRADLPYTLEAVQGWRDILDVNVVGALLCSAACHDAMSARGGGAIVNMSSMAAYGGNGAYGMSKLALNSLTVSLAGAYGPDGIRVNGIAPGLVDSAAAMQWSADQAQTGMNIKKLIVDGQVIRRQGRMDDLADLALFLCSERASFITGQTILVDGGYTKKPY